MGVLCQHNTVSGSPPSPFSRSLAARLHEAIVAAILATDQPPEDPAQSALLPSVRALAAREGANPLTVAKAYQHFQDEGLVVALRGIGMMALPGAARRLREAERTRFLTQEWPQVAARMYRLGLTLADLPGMDALR